MLKEGKVSQLQISLDNFQIKFQYIKIPSKIYNIFQSFEALKEFYQYTMGILVTFHHIGQ